ncbi:50S ribosomal protein L4 [Ferruginivarius sediminum]|jgi:large subunit ribosomal protein L4|uniref:Large ribosomal subunit protein uL4 n=1 Tax=Ferruginivarius sediminum TaxID=2661937 RepID=A0A369TAW5_9PROT|nr:50S ribosomal protein L4 [Ferruginivarius sediminum]RDD61634.1 50S ribosomal protein L4 [Ferruginivarius sediminum]
MKCPVKTLDNNQAGEIELSDAVFGAPVRKDILARVVEWQLAKRRAGTASTKTRGEVEGSTRKIFRQKGTGRARHGAVRANIFRGGGIAHGPRPRSFGKDLPKKVRRLGLKSALSAKASEGKLIVLDDAKAESPKTREMRQKLQALGIGHALIVGGEQLDENFSLAVRNIVGIDVLPMVGANVHDILRHDTLVLTKEAAQALEARLT